MRISLSGIFNFKGLEFHVFVSHKDASDRLAFDPKIFRKAFRPSSTIWTACLGGPSH